MYKETRARKIEGWREKSEGPTKYMHDMIEPHVLLINERLAENLLKEFVCFAELCRSKMEILDLG